MQAARQAQTTEAFRQDYAALAGVESAHAQAVRRYGLRQCRYIGLAKTHLQHVATVVAIHLIRVWKWLAGTHETLGSGGWPILTGSGLTPYGSQ